MGTVNKVILVGRLGANPELIYTTSGQPRCSMSLATSQNFVDKQGKKTEKVSWHKLVSWGKQGELCRDHLCKGRQIYVEGKLDSRSYTDKEGVLRHITEIIANQIVFLDSAKKQGQPGDPQGEVEGLTRKVIDADGLSEAASTHSVAPASSSATMSQEVPF